LLHCLEATPSIGFTEHGCIWPTRMHTHLGLVFLTIPTLRCYFLAPTLVPITRPIGSDRMYVHFSDPACVLSNVCLFSGSALYVSLAPLCGMHCLHYVLVHLVGHATNLVLCISMHYTSHPNKHITMCPPILVHRDPNQVQTYRLSRSVCSQKSVGLQHTLCTLVLNVAWLFHCLYIVLYGIMHGVCHTFRFTRLSRIISNSLFHL